MCSACVENNGGKFFCFFVFSSSFLYLFLLRTSKNVIGSVERKKFIIWKVSLCFCRLKLDPLKCSFIDASVIY
jgi:hypothetical protein